MKSLNIHQCDWMIYFITREQGHLFHSNLVDEHSFVEKVNTQKTQVKNYRAGLFSEIKLGINDQNIILWTKKEVWNINFSKEKPVIVKDKRNFKIFNNKEKQNIIEDVRIGTREIICIIVQ
jgi:hypothetical protein